MSRHSIIVILLAIAAIAIITVALPRKAGVKKYNYEVNQPWRYPTLFAEFSVERATDEATVKRIEAETKATFVPIYKRDNTLAAQQLDSLTTTLRARSDVSAATSSRIIHEVTSFFAAGIVDATTFDAIASGSLPKIRFKSSNGVVQTVTTEQMRSSRNVYQWLDSALKASDSELDLQSTHINRFLQPNILPDKEENDKYLKSAIEEAMPHLDDFMPGEAIVTQGAIITPETKTYIDTYLKTLEERSNAQRGGGYTKLGQIAVVTILMVVMLMFLYYMRPRTYARLKAMVFILSLVTLFITLVMLIVAFRYNFLYIIPFALVPIIITTFLDARTAFFIHMVVVLICSLAVTGQADFIIMQFLAGGIATVSMQELTKRSQLVRCSLFIFLAYGIAHVALELVRGKTMADIDPHMFIYFGTNCVVLSFAYFGIFIVEKIFGFTSTVTLVELSDINNRTLRELAESCPGTFQHVLQVANIAQEAAMKVGANVQLARAGALYHDIGKIDNPAFFTENQSGVNPHDALAPEQSAHIIIEHVANGLRRAEKARLPEVIRDLIAQHHGKGVVKYFYNKACQAAPEGTTVDPAPFTYPGPNPRSKEAAILMMADACEAAAKSLKEYNVEAITSLVDRIVNTQVAEGLFRDAPISFKDVETVKKVFTERLCAFYHTRISYPDDAV